MKTVTLLMILVGLSSSARAEGMWDDDGPTPKKACAEVMRPAPPSIKNPLHGMPTLRLLASFAKLVSFKHKKFNKVLTIANPEERYFLYRLIVGNAFSRLPHDSELRTAEDFQKERLTESFVKDVLANFKNWELSLSGSELTISLKNVEAPHQSQLTTIDKNRIEAIQEAYYLLHEFERRAQRHLGAWEIQKFISIDKLGPKLREFEQAYRIYAKIEASRDGNGQLPEEPPLPTTNISRNAFLTSAIGFAGLEAIFPPNWSEGLAVCAIGASVAWWSRAVTKCYSPVKADYKMAQRIVSAFPNQSWAIFAPLSQLAKQEIKQLPAPSAPVFLKSPEKISDLPAPVPMKPVVSATESASPFNDAWIADSDLNLANEAQVRRLGLDLTEIVKWLNHRESIFRAQHLQVYKAQLKEQFLSYKVAAQLPVQRQARSNLSQAMSHFAKFSADAMDEIDELLETIPKIENFLEQRLKLIEQSLKDFPDDSSPLKAELQHQGNTLSSWLLRLARLSLRLETQKPILASWKRALESLQLTAMDCHSGICSEDSESARRALIETLDTLLEDESK